MNLVFEIAGQLCAAQSVTMRGNTIEADFPRNAYKALAKAFDRAGKVSLHGVPALSVTYSVQDYRLTEDAGCRATFSVNSSQGRVLH